MFSNIDIEIIQTYEFTLQPASKPITFNITGADGIQLVKNLSELALCGTNNHIKELIGLEYTNVNSLMYSDCYEIGINTPSISIAYTKFAIPCPF